MRKILTILPIATALVVGLAAVPAPFAQDAQAPSRSRMGHGMMGGMQMKGQRSQMMDHCSQMMGRMADPGSGRPNEQWRQQTPKMPERKS
jgi:hypothetical protein